MAQQFPARHLSKHRRVELHIARVKKEAPAYEVFNDLLTDCYYDCEDEEIQENLLQIRYQVQQLERKIKLYEETNFLDLINRRDRLVKRIKQVRNRWASAQTREDNKGSVKWRTIKDSLMPRLMALEKKILDVCDSCGIDGAVYLRIHEVEVTAYVINRD